MSQGKYNDYLSGFVIGTNILLLKCNTTNYVNQYIDSFMFKDRRMCKYMITHTLYNKLFKM